MRFLRFAGSLGALGLYFFWFPICVSVAFCFALSPRRKDASWQVASKWPLGGAVTLPRKPLLRDSEYAARDASH
uniref:Putative secreted peptide n=1 Tax=Anopheles braziliensis TaxID=58242 RepID=A0A2M3ZNZ9_9DIPT